MKKVGVSVYFTWEFKGMVNETLEILYTGTGCAKFDSFDKNLSSHEPYGS